MFEGPVTGNIPEVLDNGEVTDGTHVSAGQLALALTPYTQVADLAMTKSTLNGVDLKLSNYSTIGSIASANNATLATVAANYGLKTVVDQRFLDIAARITPLEATLSGGRQPQRWPPSLQAETPISGLQASKADASALTAPLLVVNTFLEVDSKIAAADAAPWLPALRGGRLDTSVDTKIANAPRTSVSGLGFGVLGPPFFIFLFFLSPAKVGSLEMQPGAKLRRISRGHYFAAIRLHAAF